MDVRRRRFAIGFCLGVGFAYSAHCMALVGLGRLGEAWAIVTLFPGLMLTAPILDSVFDASPRDYLWLVFAVSAMVYGAIGGGAGYFSSPSSRRNSGGSGEPPRCKKCGYSLKGNTSGICPECGQQVRLHVTGHDDG